ncbi:hypothetical protein [Calothrix sp. NIES-2098]|nr:hypothetical protein NIES2098_19400 [Calothrix sp. NIES-2098]
MKAIKVMGTIDEQGQLTLDRPLTEIRSIIAEYKQGAVEDGE